MVTQSQPLNSPYTKVSGSGRDNQESVTVLYCRFWLRIVITLKSSGMIRGQWHDSWKCLKSKKERSWGSPFLIMIKMKSLPFDSEFLYLERIPVFRVPLVLCLVFVLSLGTFKQRFRHKWKYQVFSFFRYKIPEKYHNRIFVYLPYKKKYGIDLWLRLVIVILHSSGSKNRISKGYLSSLKIFPLFLDIDVVV